VAAIERGAPGNVYNVADDEPAQVKEWLPALAGMLGAKPPLHVPAWLSPLIAGQHIVAMMTQVRARSTPKAQRETHRRPRAATWRAGFTDVIRQDSARRAAA